MGIITFLFTIPLLSLLEYSYAIPSGLTATKSQTNLITLIHITQVPGIICGVISVILFILYFNEERQEIIYLEKQVAIETKEKEAEQVVS